MKRASFHVTQVDATFKVVWLVDHDGAVSITNDAENVVRDVNRSHPGYRIIYRDTDGNWDELKHTAGEFQSFAPARDMTPEAWLTRFSGSKP
jgi:hypothetical protein